MNVIIALDSSGSAQAALAAALARRWPDGTQFKILTVLPAKPRTSNLFCKYDSVRDRARGLLELATRELEARNPDSIVVGQIDVGDPAKKIVELSEAWPADLIIVGSHDRNPLERIFMGSVSRSVLNRARCAVFVARNLTLWQPDFVPISRVLVAVNETPQSRAAINAVLNGRWPAHARFHIFAAMRPMYSVCGWEPGVVAVNNCLDSEALVRSNLEAFAENVADEFKNKFGRHRVDITVVEGEPGELIPQVADAWGAHLITVGSGGKSDLFARLAGSVSHAVATQAKCSVQVVRRAVTRLELPDPAYAAAEGMRRAS